MEIHINAHKTTAPCTGIWQKQSLDRVSDCISFLRTKQQTAPVPMWQMPCPTPISLRRAHCKGVIAAVFLFNTILHLTRAFTQTIANMVTKPSSSWGEHYIFREVHLFFQNTGAAYISLPTYVDLRQCMGHVSGIWTTHIVSIKKWHCPWRTKSNIKPKLPSITSPHERAIWYLCSYYMQNISSWKHEAFWFIGLVPKLTLKSKHYHTICSYFHGRNRDVHRVNAWICNTNLNHRTMYWCILMYCISIYIYIYVEHPWYNPRCGTTTSGAHLHINHTTPPQRSQCRRLFFDGTFEGGLWLQWWEGHG